MLKIFNTPGIWRQLVASIAVCIPTLCCGLSFGWTSTVVPYLEKQNNTLGIEPLTLDQTSRLTSALSLTPFFILFVCGSFCEIFGRKLTGLLIALPFTLCWLLRLFATNFYHILAAQILYGIGDGFSFLLAPLYITKITSVSVRGFMASFVLFSFKIGLLLGYVLGTVLSYKVFAIVGLMVPIVYFGGALLLPESPVWLARHHRVDNAKKSLMWLRMNDTSMVEKELMTLQEFNKEMRETKSLSRLKELFRDRAVIKGQMIGIILVLGQQLAGINIVILYTVTIFDAAQSSIDSYVATIISGVMQVIGVVLSAIVIERTGRRPLLFASSSGVITCHVILGTLFLVQSLKYDVSSVGWLPIVAIGLFAVTYSIGLGPMCYIVANEVYHPDVASFCNSVTLFFLNLTSFMTAKFFPVLGDSIGLHYCFFILGIFCICTFLLIFFFVPETKGRMKESILNELRSRKKEPGESQENVTI